MTLTETLSVTLRETLGERAVRGEEQSEKGRQLRGEGEKKIGMIEEDGRMESVAPGQDVLASLHGRIVAAKPLQQRRRTRLASG